MRLLLRSFVPVALVVLVVVAGRSGGGDAAPAAPAVGLALRVAEESGEGRGIYVRRPLGTPAATTLRAPVAALLASPQRVDRTRYKADATITFAPPVTVSTVDTQAAEPSIRVDANDPSHRIWISAPTGIGARTPVLSAGGDLFWHSDNNGATWTVHEDTTLAGGGDSDATTGVGNEVYVTGLTLANVTLAASCDNGMIFATSPISTAGTIEDRQWLDTYEDSAKPLGAPDFLLNIGLSNLLGPGQNPRVVLYQAFSPACASPTTLPPIDTALPTCPLDITITIDCYQWPGNLAIDEGSGDVYVTYNTLGTDSLTNVPSINDDKVVVARIDGGASAPATSATVLTAAANRPDTFDSFTSTAVDNAGNVYVVWSERHPGVQETASMYSFSTNAGASWSTPIQVNQGPKTTTFPWIVAGDDGRVDIVYYGTDATGPSPESMPAGAQWKVYMAQSLNGTSAGPPPTFTEAVATGVMHQGSICTSGTGCTAGTRDLLDLLMIDIDEQGFANIAYTHNFPTSGGEYVTFVQQNGGTDLLGSPTAVRLVSFAARRSQRGVVLRWRTASEPSLLGFNVLRTSPAGTTKVNRALIPARGPLRGAAYRLVDRTAHEGVTYTYRLQTVRSDGTRAWARSLRVTPR